MRGIICKSTQVSILSVESLHITANIQACLCQKFKTNTSSGDRRKSRSRTACSQVRLAQKKDIGTTIIVLSRIEEPYFRTFWNVVPEPSKIPEKGAYKSARKQFSIYLILRKLFQSAWFFVCPVIVQPVMIRPQKYTKKFHSTVKTEYDLPEALLRFDDYREAAVSVDDWMITINNRPEYVFAAQNVSKCFQDSGYMI